MHQLQIIDLEVINKKMEQEGDNLNLSTHVIKTSQITTQLGEVVREQNGNRGFGNGNGNVFSFDSRIKHVYLEEENVYGRFVPFLLLKDQLHSQIDTSGTTALIHMCSHNSPYLPLYLSSLNKNDPILNKATPIGHTPLDVAGLYCRKEYVDLLREKGAIDNGKVDNWAIQGGNLENWSGQVNPDKPELIHWAAYNDLPEVLARYAQAGCNVDKADGNGNTPIDLTVINKSYDSLEVLARLGFRPKKKLLQEAESPYMIKLINELDQSLLYKQIIRSLKIAFIPLVLLLQFFIVKDPNIYLILIALWIWAYLIIVKTVPDDRNRPSKFHSDIFNKEINYESNHKAYVLFFVFLVINTLATLISIQSRSFVEAIGFWINFAFFIIFGTNLGILLYGIFTNTTPNEMFESHKNKHLWPKIDYIPHKNMLVRVYKNQATKDFKSNVMAYIEM